MAFGNIWLGVRMLVEFDSITGGQFGEFSLDNIHVINGVSRIDRLLIRWDMKTDQLENTEIGAREVWPVGLAVDYFPAPDGEPGAQGNEAGGGAMFRANLDWVPSYFTDGALFAKHWYARQGIPQSVQGRRLIHDKTVALLGIDIRGFDSGGPILDTDLVWPTMKGWVQVDYLLANAII